MDLGTLAECAQGQFLGSEAEKKIPAKAITTDSRDVREGSVFACIKGERSDGHDYAAVAQASGAVAVICEKRPEGVTVPVILVDSTLKALQKAARGILDISGVKVIGIGGSVGKTSTKEMIASVVSQKYNIIKTSANHNNELGLPLTVFEITDETQVAVLEMGIDDFGQMHTLAEIAQPDVCVLTNIGDCHLENLGDRDGVLRAKSEMFDFLKKDGKVLLCGDDERLFSLKEVHGVKPVFYGIGEINDVRADDIVTNGIEGSAFKIYHDGRCFNANVSVPGMHYVVNACAGAAAGIAMGLSEKEIEAGLAAYTTISGRFNIIKTSRYTLIDDCYNANPMSMKASLSSLAKASGRKVALLGDMGELGENEKELHAEVGAYAAECGIDALYCCGELSKYMAEGAAEAGLFDVAYFKDREELLGKIGLLLKAGDTILVKASHFMGFEKVVEMLMSF